MLFKNMVLFGFAAVALANNDPECDSDNDGDDDNNCSNIAQATSTDINGIVLTSRITTSDIGRTTTYVPVVTGIVDTTTDIGVNTERQTLTETTDYGTTPTNTIIQVVTTSDVNLQSGYAYTTDSNGKTIATFTGTGMAPSGTPVAGDDNDSTSSTDSGSFATAVPYLGAAAMAGLAFVL